MSQCLNRLRELRISSGYTQLQIATEIKISDRHYRKYETSEVAIPSDTLVYLADFYNVSVDYLLGRTPVSDIYTQQIYEYVISLGDVKKLLSELLVATKNTKALFDKLQVDSTAKQDTSNRT